MNRKFLSLCTVAAGAMMWASAANADLITVGLQDSAVNGSDISVAGIATAGSFEWPSGVSYGTFHTQGNAYDATDPVEVQPPEILTSTSVDSSTTGAGTLTVYVTDQGLTSAAAAEEFESQFGLSHISAGVTVTESTYLDTSDGLYNAAVGTTCTPTAPSDQCFTPVGEGTGKTGETTATGLNTTDLLGTIVLGPASTGNNEISLPQTLSGPFSITEVYTITANAAGEGVSLTETVDSVPEPATLSLFGAALLGLAATLGRKRKGKGLLQQG